MDYDLDGESGFVQDVRMGPGTARKTCFRLNEHRMSGRRHALRSESGVTLIEVMVSLGLIAVAVVVVLSLLTASGVGNEINHQTAMAYKACQDVAEFLMAMNYNDILDLKNASAWNRSWTMNFQATKVVGTPTGVATVTAIGDQSPFNNPPDTVRSANDIADDVLEIVVKVERGTVRGFLTVRRSRP
jgi:Tfp pilus assembly protein PilV